eukprot:CAMPEP_0197461448 /NCGR_PEP_ID=MMETSP1175-20131217/56602_1 /TAXON_ID=1003142 /ORGANISM="Triceratium dubium, Strain CCMP147" /LENGTH=40 /DNA_ID= /DNA_START= /DNA_END= /DNA_ORIENTATION=
MPGMKLVALAAVVASTSGFTIPPSGRFAGAAATRSVVFMS